MAGGQIAYVPPDTRHNVFNTGTGPLRYLYIVSRALAD
jgi:oxalate decarboxylase/phosphoglucose isomerase-like protein (cupin superfamily)